MVSGSGDGTARIWDCDTGTPWKTLDCKPGSVLAVSYSPDGAVIATGSLDGSVRFWDATTAQQVSGGKSAKSKGSKNWINAFAWEPYHLQQPQRPRVAAASKDAIVRIWDVMRGSTDIQLTGHKASVSCVRWGGNGNIYTGSQDRTIKVWESKGGTLIQTLTAHAHWVNHLALSTDAVLRTSYIDPERATPAGHERSVAQERFERVAKVSSRISERLVSASDDNKVYLWNTGDLKKPVARLDGHNKLVNHVSFSPDGHYIASCGFDNIVILWRAEDGKFLKKLVGHVAPVYQCCFSADSRLLVSASKDTTLKVWDVASGKLSEDLPGHQDQVFAVDWSPDGKRVGSGGADKKIMLWTH